ncbi:Short integuments 2, mitochondrial, partial [Rhizophlyctis rosea]
MNGLSSSSSPPRGGGGGTPPASSPSSSSSSSQPAPPSSSSSLSASAAVALAQKLAATSLNGTPAANGKHPAVPDEIDDDADAGGLFAADDAQEDLDAPVSHKSWYLTPTPTTLPLLTTHLNYLLTTGQNETILELGLEPDGSSMSFTPTEYATALSTLRSLMPSLKADLTILHERPTAILQTTPTSGSVEDLTKLALDHSTPSSSSDSAPPTHAHILIRRPPTSPEYLVDIRICVVGNVDAGKSTLLGVLTKSVLDDGRGKARINLFRHKHEIESGRTSSVGMEIMGFDSRGNVIGDALGGKDKEGKGQLKIGWEEVVERSSKVLTFMDLAGHEKYLKTTVFGMTGGVPDYVMLMIGANAGLIGMTREHLGLALALSVPVYIVITKIDMCPVNVLENTIKQLCKILRSSGCRKVPVFVRSVEDVVWCLGKGGVGDRICPIFQISNVTGHNLPLLRLFLSLLPPRHSPSSPQSSSQPIEYQITDTFSVPGVGTVVSGTLITGTVRVGDSVLLGPDGNGKFVETMVKSIQRKRVNVSWIGPGAGASFALKKVKRGSVRKGMVIVSQEKIYKGVDSKPTSELEAASVWEFDAEVVVLYHSTTIGARYQAMVHCGCVRQTAKILRLGRGEGRG